MEIYMNGIGPQTTKSKVIKAIAVILHAPDYAQDSSLPLNFDVRLFRNRTYGGRLHSGQGALTLPHEHIGSIFLREYGGFFSRKSLIVDGKRINVEKSRQPPRPDIVEAVRHLPYRDPTAIEEQEKQKAQLQERSIGIRTLQFGWECRDSVFSVEWERSYPRCSLSFNDERREIQIKILQPNETLVVAIRFSQILWTGCSHSASDGPTIYMSLATPPAFESDTLPRGSTYDRRRLSALDDDHSRVVQYTSQSIRLICYSRDDVASFRWLSGKAHLHKPQDFDYPVERRDLFSAAILDQFQKWLLRQAWPVAFQAQALVQRLLVDVKEMLELAPGIERIADSVGAQLTSAFLRHFSADAKMLLVSQEMQDAQPESISQCFYRSEQNFTRTSIQHPLPRPSDSVFNCLHVEITPTKMFLEGPFPERSNRVIRAYPDNEDCFLRVSFIDENRLQYRFDREVDGPTFVKSRVGSMLRNGLSIAGRPFQFLAYSQSALKEHAVIFVKAFYDETGVRVDAPTIIRGLGTFHDLPFDRGLIYCPARYGARISQAFTATDYVSVEAEEVLYAADIEHDGGCFTDGVGTISSELAKEIWRQLHAARRRPGRSRSYPRCFQVRFMGSKGMLSVDYRLSGLAVCLRRSMIKFEAPESRNIEIARAFDKPGRYYLNRPLIMLLEGLGVPYEVFRDFQNAAVLDAQDSADSLPRAAHFLEAYGLGSSFRLTSIMLSLDKLGVDVSLLNDVFYKQMMEFAINHVLRELKQHARIPIPGGWTLVGVADEHKFLKSGQIFACIKNPDSSKITYLEGPVLISRSPTIHPGDVQVAHAIGKPTPGTCFDREPLPNSVVFSVQGDRPLPSCLGGGDLDGDVYNIIPLNKLPQFRPKHCHKAATYEPVPKKTLDRHSTMEDVADFVVDYINSDVLGLIAINWLIIADRSQKGILDEDCLKLADLHSAAVDFPKSGQPVALKAIPKLKSRTKPDWNAPETVGSNTPNYYESPRAIGRLFRAIDLPALKTVKKTAQSQQWQLQEIDKLSEILEGIHLEHGHDDPIREAIEERVSQYGVLAQDIDHEVLTIASRLFSRYVSELRTICSTHTLSYGRSAMLTEEEAVVGTIVAKCSQPRRRKDIMTKLREQTDVLVRTIREELTVDRSEPLESWVKQAWVAWEVSCSVGKTFGAKSFGYIALGGIFEAIKAIEDDEKI